MSAPDPDAVHRNFREGSDRRALAVLAGHTGDVPAARAALGDPDGRVREAAVGALTRLDAWDAPTLARMLADGSPRVRRRAAVAASRTRVAGEARSTLVSLLGDDDATVVEVACFAVGERPDAGDDGVDALVAVATSHEDHLCREAAVAALGSVVAASGDDLEDGSVAAAEAAVLAGTRDRANVRRRAVLALAAFDDEAATEALRRLTGDRDLQVRQAAEDLLGITDGEAVGSDRHGEAVGSDRHGEAVESDRHGDAVGDDDA